MGSSISTILPQLKIRYQEIVIWIDQSSDNLKQENQLRAVFNVIKIRNVSQAMKYFDQFARIKKINVICQGSLSQDLYKQLQKRGSLLQEINYIIFCFDVEAYKNVKNSRVLNVIDNTACLIKQIKKIKNSSPSLPKFRIFDKEKENADEVKLSFILNALTHKIDDSHPERNELRNNFITALNHFYKTQNIIQYPLKPTDQQILNIYSSKFIYQYVKAAIQTAGIQQMAKTNIFVADLFQTVKQISSFQHRNSISESVFYCGGFYNEDDKKRLRSLVHKDIEFLGFLEAFKEKSHALDMITNVLFTIYIPTFFKDSTFKQVKLNGGYIQFKNFEGTILFNIKTVMRIIRYRQEGKIIHFELIFGIDQMMKYAKISQDYVIHNLIRDQYPKNCPCDFSQHLIQAKTMKIICLNKITNQQLKKQSFFLLNSKYKIKGIPIYYSEQSNKIMASNQYNEKQYLRCSSCIQPHFLCQLIQNSSNCLSNHPQSHLGHSVIYVEGSIPHIISLQNQEQNIKDFQKCKNNEETIGDSLMMANRDYCFTLAKQWYNKYISKDCFKKIDEQIKAKIYFNRSEAQYKSIQKLQKSQYQLCLNDVKESINILTKSNKIQKKLLVKCYHLMSLINKDLGQYDEAQKFNNKAIQMFKSQVKQQDELTIQQIQINIALYNTQVSYKRRRQKYQEVTAALDIIISLIQSIGQIQRRLKIDLAQYYSQLADAYKIRGKFKQSVKALKQRYLLLKALYGAENIVTINSLIKYNTQNQLQRKINL